jgi:hypothetical protein
MTEKAVLTLLIPYSSLVAGLAITPPGYDWTMNMALTRRQREIQEVVEVEGVVGISLHRGIEQPVTC